MRVGPLGRMMLVSSLLALALSGSVIADDRSEFARETGLDIDLVGVIQVDVNGTELTVVFVFINVPTAPTMSPTSHRLNSEYLSSPSASR